MLPGPSVPLSRTRKVPARATGTLQALAFVACAFLNAQHSASASCGSAFCMVNTNWNLQGLAPEPGLRIDTRFEYINQHQPMSGSDRVGFGEIRRHHDELRTINRNYITTLEAAFDTTDLEAGDYQLTLRRQGGEWQMFPLRIR